MFKGRLPRISLVLAFAVSAAIALSCSSKSNNNNKGDAAPPVQCDPMQCGQGNTCIDDGTGTGPICHETCTAQTCRFGYFCNDGAPASDAGPNLQYNPPAFCQPLTGNGMSVMAASDGGLAPWGVRCDPMKGESGNTDCDTNQNFACYGTRPADPLAFCTQFNCAADSDCPGGWWCATVNTAPNVKTATASFGQTRTVCLPRESCSPCLADHDCSSTTGNGVNGNGPGYPLHCVAEPKPKMGTSGMFCTHTCKTSVDCAQDQVCQPSQAYSVCLSPDSGMACSRDEDCPPGGPQGYAQHCELEQVDGGGFSATGQCTAECGGDGDCDMGQHCMRSKTTYCTPRAGLCNGSGNFCDPCYSDADCTAMGGYCFVSPYSFEKFCSVKRTQTGCNNMTPANPPGCPMRVSGENWKATACTTMPADQCVGLITTGTASGMQQYLPGCWTQNQ